MDYFPDDFVTFVDESHQTIPQIGGMYEGDRSRKQTLVDFGFRLPSALDNRPLKFDEFMPRVGQLVMVSATPGEFERSTSARVVEQIVRPTGIVDPEIEVRETRNQIDDLMNEVRERVEREERTLVTTLTKKMAEDLTGYLLEHGFRVRYLHSEVDTLERIQIIRDLRLGEYDVLVGVNLLREGLDLPEVTLVAVLDADKEGFLRGETSLIQTIGRAARNVNGRVLMYADKETDAMRNAISETDRRREIQIAYNREARDHAGDGAEGDLRAHRVPLDGVQGLPRPAPAPALRRRRAAQPRAARAGRGRARGGDGRGRRGPPLRAGGADSRRAQGAPPRPRVAERLSLVRRRSNLGPMNGEQIVHDVAERVREIVSDAERRAAEIIREAEGEAERIRERARCGVAGAPGGRPQRPRGVPEQARPRRRGRAAGDHSGARAAPSIPEPTPPPDPGAGARAGAGADRRLRFPSRPRRRTRARRRRCANGRSDDAAAARLVAMNMALDGASREAIEAGSPPTTSSPTAPRWSTKFSLWPRSSAGLGWEQPFALLD